MHARPNDMNDARPVEKPSLSKPKKTVGPRGGVGMPPPSHVQPSLFPGKPPTLWLGHEWVDLDYRGGASSGGVYERKKKKHPFPFSPPLFGPADRFAGSCVLCVACPSLSPLLTINSRTRRRPAPRKKAPPSWLGLRPAKKTKTPAASCPERGTIRIDRHLLIPGAASRANKGPPR